MSNPNLGALVAAEQHRAHRYGDSYALLSVEALTSVATRFRATDAVALRGSKRSVILLRDIDRSSVEGLAAGLTSALSSAALTLLEGPEVELFEPADDAPFERRLDRPVAPPGASHVSVTCEPAGVLALLSREPSRWKRWTDVVLAATGLILGLPLFLLIALAIKATSRGPALFVQQRTGRNLRRFGMYKFRTMRTGADRLREGLGHRNEMSGPLFKMDRDPRLTPIGGFLRRWSLDELPQLVNVLRGDMTLIGPRALSPFPWRYDRWHLVRFEVTPGIACSWQASRRGETDFDEWMRADIRYVERESSLLHDVKLLVATLLSVLTRSGSR